MIFCIVVIAVVSIFLLIAPVRQLLAFFSREEKRTAAETVQRPAAKIARRLRLLGVMIRNEDHPQHRPAVQTAMLSPVVLLTVGMMLWLLSHWR